MAWVHHNDYWLGTSKSPQESLNKAIELMQKSLAIDDSNGSFHGTLARLYSMKREYDKGIAEGERGIALAPGVPYVLFQYASCLNWVGRYEEAIPLLQKAIRLDPFGPNFYYFQLGLALKGTGQFEKAVSAFKNTIQRAPENILPHVQLAATYSLMGREEEARAEVAEVFRINPKFSLDYYAKSSVTKDRSAVDTTINALHKAGLK